MKLSNCSATYSPGLYKTTSIVLLLLILIGNAGLVRAQGAENPYQISGPSVAFGDVDSGYQISPDGKYVVYKADSRIDGVVELFSVSIRGCEVTRLNPNLVANGDVLQYQISPDSTMVVYIADQSSDGVNEVFGVPIAGGQARRLNSQLTNGGDVTLFQISPNSQRVIYISDQRIDNLFALYDAPIYQERFSIQLSRFTNNADLDVNAFRISADGGHVVYRADLRVNDTFELFSVPSSVIAGTSVQLNPSLSTGRDVTQFEISPDDSRVVYMADQRIDGVAEIFSVPLLGGAAVLLNPAFSGESDVSNFIISPSSNNVVYRSDQRIDNAFELYTVPLAGGESVQLNGTLFFNSTRNVNTFAISPDGEWTVYLSDQTINDRFEIYKVPTIGGRSPVQLNTRLADDGDVSNFRISEDSKMVVYRADQDTDGIFELYSVALMRGDRNVNKLNSPLVEGGDVGIPFRISPDGSYVAYIADQDTDTVSEAFHVDIRGGMPTKINRTLPFNADVDRLAISKDRTIVYLSDQDVYADQELFGYRVPDNELCIPIKARNGKVVLICL